MPSVASRCLATLLLVATATPAAAQFGSRADLPPVQRPNLPNLGDSASDDLSPATERKLGDEIMRQAFEAGDVMDDLESTEYLNQLGELLVSRLGPGDSAQNFRFFLVREPAINAFALPGGYIGIHSGLVVAAQAEGELAAVLAHEMGHVLQRHIARSIARQRQTSMVALASMLLGVVAASRSSTSDVGQGAIVAGQSYMIADQLSFGRDAEREADRVGFRILEDAGFDVNAMTTFFGRLQQATRINDTRLPAFLQSHPLTTERIADIQDRIRETPYKQRPDNQDFHFVRARLRVLQDTTAQGLRDARTAFEEQLATRATVNEAGARYGLALTVLRQGDAKRAQEELGRLQKLAAGPDPLVASLAIDIRQASGDADGAIELAREARQRFPLSRVLAQNYADALQSAGRHDEAIAFLREQTRLYRSEPAFYEQLARSYEAKGDAMVSHRLLGEAYLLRGSVRAALEQMRIARRSAPAAADFYELSQIDARVRELQAKAEELKKAEKESGVTTTR